MSSADLALRFQEIALALGRIMPVIGGPEKIMPVIGGPGKTKDALDIVNLRRNIDEKFMLRSEKSQIAKPD